MKAARTKPTLVVVAAALVLFGVLGAFFHQHAPILPTTSEACPGSDAEAAFGHTHLLPAHDETDDCTICFFQRCASHGAPVVALTSGLEFDPTSVVSVPGMLPDSLLDRLKEARAPPGV